MPHRRMGRPRHGEGVNADQVVELVRQRLKAQRTDGITIDVVADGIRRDGDWWYVPVRPDREPQRTYQYYEWLLEVEDDVKSEAGIDVLLVPSS